jgi:hypothetical protein
MYAISPNITKITSISQELIVSVDECGKWLNLSPSAITMQNDMLESLIKAATEQVENYTWLSLRRKTFQAHYDLHSCLFTEFANGNLKLGLMRAPILAITDIADIEYLDDTNTWTTFNKGTMTIDGLYDNVTEKEEQRQWASVKFRESVSFQRRCNAYKIRITFQAGYDPLETDPPLKIPELIKIALKQIVALHYTYRGDCQSDCNINGYPVPCQVKGLVDSISVRHSFLGNEYRPASDYYGGLYGCTE